MLYAKCLDREVYQAAKDDVLRTFARRTLFNALAFFCFYDLSRVGLWDVGMMGYGT